MIALSVLTELVSNSLKVIRSSPSPAFSVEFLRLTIPEAMLMLSFPVPQSITAFSAPKSVDFIVSRSFPDPSIKDVPSSPVAGL